MALAIGIDIGGTSTKTALVDDSGKILATRRFPSHSDGGAADFLPNLSKAIKYLIQHAVEGEHLAGIGIGAPSCNELAGTIEGAANLPFKRPFPIVRLLREAIGLPVWLTKDSSAALLGESRFGSARGLKNFILLTLGTGLGSAIMTNGYIVKGGNGLAGEAGHIPVAGNERKCACGKTGCLETIASAVGLKRTAMHLMAEEVMYSNLHSYSYEQLTAQLIYEAARDGDALAGLVFEKTGRVLGRKMAELVTVLEPEAIILTGGVAAAGNLLVDPMRHQMESELLAFHKDKVRILCTSLATDEAALLGAASLVWDQQQSVPVN